MSTLSIFRKGAACFTVCLLLLACVVLFSAPTHVEAAEAGKVDVAVQHIYPSLLGGTTPVTAGVAENSTENLLTNGWQKPGYDNVTYELQSVKVERRAVTPPDSEAGYMVHYLEKIFIQPRSVVVGVGGDKYHYIDVPGTGLVGNPVSFKCDTYVNSYAQGNPAIWYDYKIYDTADWFKGVAQPLVASECIIREGQPNEYWVVYEPKPAWLKVECYIGEATDAAVRIDKYYNIDFFAGIRIDVGSVVDTMFYEYSSFINVAQHQFYTYIFNNGVPQSESEITDLYMELFTLLPGENTLILSYVILSRSPIRPGSFTIEEVLPTTTKNEPAVEEPAIEEPAIEEQTIEEQEPEPEVGTETDALPLPLYNDATGSGWTTVFTYPANGTSYTFAQGFEYWVTYTYRAVSTGGGGGGNDKKDPPTTTTPEPKPEPEPEPEPEPDKPAEPVDRTPSEQAPSEPAGPPPVLLDANGVPLGEWVQNEDGEWIFMPFVPMGDLPQTGVGAGMLPLVLLALGLMALAVGLVLKFRQKAA